MFRLTQYPVYVAVCLFLTSSHAANQDCPVPCGFYKQLCCNLNEICYTAPNLEAECSATGPPVQATRTVTAKATTVTTVHSKTVTASPETLTSVIVRTKSVLHESVSRYNITTTRTTVKQLPGSILRTTATTTLSGAVAGGVGHTSANSGGDPVQTTGSLQEKMPVWEKGAIGGASAAVGLAVIGLVLLLCLKRGCFARDRRKEDEVLPGAFEDTEPEMQTARIRHTSSQRLPRPEFVAELIPREPPHLYGPNPYDQLPSGAPQDANDIAGVPPYDGRRSSPRLRGGDGRAYHNDGFGAGGGSQQSWEGPAGFAPVPCPGRRPRPGGRRPVNSLRPTVEDFEY